MSNGDRLCRHHASRAEWRPFFNLSPVCASPEVAGSAQGLTDSSPSNRRLRVCSAETDWREGQPLCRRVALPSSPRGGRLQHAACNLQSNLCVSNHGLGESFSRRVTTHSPRESMDELLLHIDSSPSYADATLCHPLVSAIARTAAWNRQVAVLISNPSTPDVLRPPGLPKRLHAPIASLPEFSGLPGHPGLRQALFVSSPCYRLLPEAIISDRSYISVTHERPHPTFHCLLATNTDSCM
ncbi:hypothetical protein GGS23DRAFT_361877 [Durotheca rogersii]|uniref:uncharacterized protein n=1 Tax=Durotheca rogersii TaxID=419775 RepID=UPI00221E7C2D|nr:uncharacterized protein GGS23DRAFT_361877 [Durotheca rogersii]KAI5865951.1 hypothetical protein GGS23DRAFT_361877 [Durotheca rogersii]